MPDVYNMSDVFISYSRKDLEFVKRLFTDIKAQEKEVWADFEDIPTASDWWLEIQAGIDAADAFVFVISPDSVNSLICTKEIDHAIASNKRFFPILYREVLTPDDKAKMHPAVSSHNWIYFRETDDYQTAFETLMKSLGTDLEHNRNLTRLLVRAKDWESHDKAASYLLVGQDLESAEAWLAAGMSKKPTPTNLHAEYIRASRLAAANRQRRMLSLVSAALVVAVLITIFAIYQTYRADQESQRALVAQADAETARDAALASESYSRSLALAANANDALSNNNPDLSLVLALEAVNISAEPPQIYSALTSATYAPSTQILIPTENVPMALLFTADGQFFIAGFIDGQICRYAGLTGEKLDCLQSGEGNAHAASILNLQMSQDGRRLLSSGADNRLRLWDMSSASSGSLMNEVTVEGLNVAVLANTGGFAVFGLADGRIGAWDLRDNSISYFDESHAAELTVLALNADNSLLLSGSEDGEVRFWEYADKVVINYFFNPDNAAPITALAFSPDSTLAVVGDNDAGLSVYNLETGTLSRTIQGHNESIRGIQFSNNARSIFTASWDNSIREWDLQTGREVTAYRGHNGGINALALTADNRSMVSGGYDTTLRLWQVRSAVYDVQFLTNEVAINSVDWTEAHIATAHSDGSVLVLDRLRGTILHEFEHATGAAIALEFSPSGNDIFVVYRNCDVAMFNVAGQIVWARPLPRLAGETCQFVRFRPESEEVLVVTGTVLQFLDARDGGDRRRVPYRPERKANLLSASFTPDGNQLIIGENYFVNNLHLVDVQTGAIIHEFVGHSDGILSIDISHDGSRAVTGGFDNDVRIWDVQTGEAITLLEGHSDRILSVEFSPNGDFVISSDNARTIRLWNLETGFTAYTYRGHNDRVTAVRFSHDGRRILTSSHDSTLIIWKFPQPLDELVTWAQANRYIRQLSCSEYKLYVDTQASCDAEVNAVEAEATAEATSASD